MHDDGRLLVDLRNVKDVMRGANWVKNQLIGLRRGKYELCVTGAIGVALEGAEFLKYAWGHAADCPEEWEWSPRAKRVIETLLETRPEGTWCALADTPLEKVVDVNDSPSMNRKKIMRWLDRAIANAEQAIEAKGRSPVVMERIATPKLEHVPMPEKERV